MDSPAKERQYKRLPPKQMRYRKSLLIAKYGRWCFWCGCNLTPETLTIDHYIPLSKGGNHKIKNLRLACNSCNNKRGNEMPEDTPEIIALQSKIRFPSHWEKPKYHLGQMVKQGQIIGIEYQPPETRRAYELGAGWLYSVLIDNQVYDTENLKQSEIQPVTSEQLQASIEHHSTQIGLHQKNLAALTKQLEEVTDRD